MRSLMSLFMNPRAVMRRMLTAIAVIVVPVLVLMWLTAGAALPDDGVPIEVNTDDALGFLERSTEALQGAGRGGSIRLTVTQEELTSFMAVGSRLSRVTQQSVTPDQMADLEALQASGEVHGTELIERWEALVDERDASGWRRLVPEDFELEVTIDEPEVRFRNDGSVIVRGTGSWGFFSVPARVVATPRVVDGRLEFDFIEGQLGRVGLSEPLFELVADGLERVLLAGGNIAEVNALDIGDGVMRISARVGSS